MENLAALDQVMSSQSGLPLPSAPPPPPEAGPRTDHYMLGAGDPTVAPDAGAGIWNSHPRTATHTALKMSIVDILPEAAIVIGVDAAVNMARYMANTGGPYQIDLEGMLNDLTRAKLLLTPKSYDQIAAALPVKANNLRAGAGRLGADDGFWNPHATTGIKSGTAALPGGRYFLMGVAESAEGVLLFLANQGA